MTNAPHALTESDLDTVSAGNAGDVDKIGRVVRLGDAPSGQWVQQLAADGAWAGRSDALRSS